MKYNFKFGNPYGTSASHVRRFWRYQMGNQSP